nr:reverse transcriptase domain-containing protein [Tanacetum cinerariifolium]
MPPKRTSTSAPPSMTQDAIRKLVSNSVTVALEAQAAAMANNNNLNRNTRPRDTPVAKRGNYKEFIRTSDHKHKFDDRRSPNNNNNYPNNHVNNYQINRNNDYRQQQNRRPKTFRSYAATPSENSGNCKNKGPATGSNQQLVLVICHAHGEKEHYANQCPKKNNNALGRTYLLRERNAHRDPNIVTSMFLLNQHQVKVLFDSGADKSFVFISLSSMLNIPPITLDTTYNIEMANGNLVGTNTIIQGCTLNLLSQPFEIDLMPIKLGSFDVVIRMDGLSKHHAQIICDEKVVHIPIDGEILIIQ